MPSTPGLFPEVSPPSKNGDESELEWLLCLASTYQACQRTTDDDWMFAWRLALRWFGVKPIERPNRRSAA